MEMNMRNIKRESRQVQDLICQWGRVVFTTVLLLGLATAVLTTATLAIMATRKPAETVTAVIEAREPQVYDTTSLDNWCGAGTDGTVRMVGAWLYSVQGTAEGTTITTVEDETGNLWDMEDVTITNENFLLLWIADNHTPNDNTDDIIVKMWTEVYQ